MYNYSILSRVLAPHGGASWNIFNRSARCAATLFNICGARPAAALETAAIDRWCLCLVFVHVRNVYVCVCTCIVCVCVCVCMCV